MQAHNILKGRRNLWVLGMLCFTVIFYGALFLMHHENQKNGPLNEIKKIERMSFQEIKDKELAVRKNLDKRPVLAAGVSLSFLLILVIGLGLNFYFLAKRNNGSFVMGVTLAQEGVGWGLREVFEIFIFMFFTEAVIVFFELIASVWLNLKAVDNDYFLMINSLLRDVIVASFVIWVVKKRYRASLDQIGLSAKEIAKNIWRGIVAYLTIVPFLFVILFLLSAVAQFFSYQPPPQPVVEIYLKQSSGHFLVFLTFFVAIIGPVIEEIFFRGFTYKAIRTRYGVRWAMVGTAFIFATLHMNWIAFVPIFALGIFLAYLYEKTGSLVPSMTAHMLHNVIMVILTLGFKWLSV